MNVFNTMKLMATSRLIFFSILTLSLAAITGCVNRRPAPPAGVVAYWYGEDAGKDSQGKHDAILHNVTLTNGIGGKAFYLNGSDGYVEIPDDAALKPANVTAEAWVKLDDLVAPVAPYPGLQYIVFKKNTRGGNFEGYELEKNRLNGHDIFRFQVTSVDGFQVPAGSVTVPQAGVWYHLAGTYDSTSGQVCLYVNGVLEGTAHAGFPMDFGPTPLFIGTTGGGWDGHTFGAVDHVGIFDRALSADEIKKQYEAEAALKH